MQTKISIKEVRKLSNVGIEFCTSHPEGGMVSLSSIEAKKFVEAGGYHGYWAKKLQMSVEDLKRVDKFLSNNGEPNVQCCGTTKSGERCKNSVALGELLGWPMSYNYKQILKAIDGKFIWNCEVHK